jgi:23S rRNA (adenine2503-C2)-methyltransferase
MSGLIDLYTLTRGEVSALFAEWKLSSKHAARLWRELYWECTASVAAMEGLPARVRARLAAGHEVGFLPIARETHSRDGFTRKALLQLRGGQVIETVLMRYRGRVTACVSSQAGCAMGCVFCATGQAGFERHLTAGEIVAQAVHVQRILRRLYLEAGRPDEPEALAHSRLRNVVLMGMGEPLHNYEAVMRAVEIFRDPSGLSLGADRITLSTVGVVPGILRLAREPHPVHLAVSLHAATQEARAALVPAAKKWPLDELMAACRAYSAQTGRRIFYEWTLIEGANDRPEDARAVGHLLQGAHGQVNLIPLNPTAGYAGVPSRTEAAKRFQRILADEFSIPSTVRQRRGIDIAAGCGQLAGS